MIFMKNNLIRKRETMKRYFSPYMIQIIKLTKDLRDGYISNREFLNSVIRTADTYEDTMINYKKDQESEE